MTDNFNWGLVAKEMYDAYTTVAYPGERKIVPWEYLPKSEREAFIAAAKIAAEMLGVKG